MHRTAAVVSMVAICLALAGETARAQTVIDMTMLTCNQFLKSDRDRQDIIAGWMSGYFNSARNVSVFNLTQAARNRNVVSAYCKRHGSETLMSAIQRNAR
jgi:acid stress chaperone HdeB